MLVHLHIRDLAIIEDAELAPLPGFNVLTGETGAGKSIIVGAVGLLRGGRLASEMVRKGAKEAVVEAQFDIAGLPRVEETLRQSGIPSEGGELIVRRVLSSSGRGRVYLNGTLSTVAVLKAVADPLIDISGQHEYQLLSDRREQRQILDAMALDPDRAKAMQAAHERVRELAELRQRVQRDEGQRAQRLDFLYFQIQELREARLQSGEDEALLHERERLQRAGELIEAATTGEQILYSGEGAVTERLAMLEKRLAGLGPVDAELAALAKQLGEARVLADDVAHSLRQYAGRTELDPARLEEVDERLALLHKLGRKHGRTVEDMLASQRAMEEEAAALEMLDRRLESLEGDLAQARGEAARLASLLSEDRQRGAERLSREVSQHLAQLRMAGARLDGVVSPQPVREGDEPALIFDGRRLGPGGWDRVELRFSANLGEEARPLAHVASGGELSRVMLALKRVLGENDPVATSIYDEVDAGIGGAVADVVGRYLAEVARHRQVLCVTHLPQVAAHADHHVCVEKVEEEGRTTTRLRALHSEAARVHELARMLGGERVSEEARENARQLLLAARN